MSDEPDDVEPEEERDGSPLSVAYREMCAAIEAYDRLNGEGGLLVDWVLVTASYVAGDERTATHMCTIGPPEQPGYRALGLLEYGAEEIRRLEMEARF